MHAENLSDSVLQSVVDLLWTQLNSVRLSVIGAVTSQRHESDDIVAPSSVDYVNGKSADTHVQCEQHRNLLTACFNIFSCNPRAWQMIYDTIKYYW